MAFLDYYQADRQLAVNAATASCSASSARLPGAKYEANQATQQDVLQADVELAEAGHSPQELRRARAGGGGADQYPAAPRGGSSAAAAAGEHRRARRAARRGRGLQSAGRRRAARPGRAGVRIRAEGAAVALACKEYYPDLELVAKYDAFMPEEMRTQVGMDLNVPIYRQKRHAA